MLDYSTFINEVNGKIRWHIINYAIENKVFDLMIEWKIASEISDLLDTDVGNTALFLDALVACGYLEKFSGRYRNSKFSNDCLISSNESYQGDVFISLSKRRIKGIDDIGALLKGGSTETHLSDESVWEEALNNLIPFQKFIIDDVLKYISSIEGVEDFRKILDLGGGPGFIGQGIAKRYKNMKLTLLDLPNVVKLAKKNSELDNMSYISGDYSEVDFGSGYDLIWASRSLYYAKDLNYLMKKAFDSLNSGGYMLALHEGVFSERTMPYEIIMNRIMIALNGSDVSFERGDIENAMKGAGFDIVSVTDTFELGGNSTMVMGRKF